MNDATVIEGTAVEERNGSPTGHELVAPPTSRDVVSPLDLGETAAAMQKYQEGLRSLLERGDWQKTGDGEFVKKSGWRKIATWFGLSLERVWEECERDENGTPLRASAIWRAIAPNGRYMDGDGYCSIDEPRFTTRDGQPNMRGRQKLENDLRATATTRAKNRAIADLVGLGAVSAEEVDAGNGGSAPKATPVQTKAESPKHDGANITAAQRNGMFACAKGTADKGKWQQYNADPPMDEAQLHALVEWIVGAEHFDRIPKAKFEEVMKALPEWQAALSAMVDIANSKDSDPIEPAERERAQKIVARLEPEKLFGAVS